MAYQTSYIDPTAPLILEDRAENNDETLQNSPYRPVQSFKQKSSFVPFERYTGRTMTDNISYGYPKKVYTRQERILNHSLDVLLLLITLPFYAFAIISLILNREIVNDNTWSNIQRFNYAVSIPAIIPESLLSISNFDS